MTRDPSAVGALAALSWRGWVVLHDLARPGKRRGTIDHVLVGPGGVFVVSRKRWPGPVAVVDGALHLGGRARQREVADVAEAAADVLALVPDVPVHPVLCLERHGLVTGWVSNVMLCATSNVEEVLTGRPAVLGPEQVHQVADVLKARLRPAPPPPSPTPETSARGPLPWPARVLLQAVTLAVAALLVIGLLQTRVVDEISAVVDDFIAQVSTIDDQPKEKPSRDERRDQSAPSPTRDHDKVKRKDAHREVKRRDRDPRARQKTSGKNGGSRSHEARGSQRRTRSLG